MTKSTQEDADGSWVFPTMVVAVLILSRLGASASMIPVQYLVDEKVLKRTAEAGTTITFELFQDPSCAAAIATDAVDADSVLILERLKQQKLRGGEKRPKLLVLHHVFSADPAGGDLFVRVTGTGIDASVAGECQPQHPIGTGVVADPSDSNELNSALSLNGTTLELTDPGGTLSADLGALVDDLDSDPLNELNSSLVLNATSLELTDAGGTLTADLGALVDDADADPTNELIQSVSLNGTVLEVTDAGGTTSVELASLGGALTTQSGAIPFPDPDARFGVHAVSFSQSFAPSFSSTPILNLTPYSPYGPLVSPPFLTDVSPAGFAGQLTLTNHFELSPDDCGCGPTFTSMALVNGRPAIGYYDASAGDLKYVRANDAIGSAWGTPVVVDSTGDVGQYVSLAVIAGRPAMSYYDATNDLLRYIESDDADGTSWSGSTPVQIVGSGRWISLAEVNGEPGISYADAAENLYYAHPALYAPPVIIAFATESVGVFGRQSSLAVVNGNPAIAYYRGGYVRYLRANDPTGSTWGTPSPGFPGGQSVSLAVVNGRPAFSYYRNPSFSGNMTEFGLAYRRADDANGATWSTASVLVDGAGNVGNFDSLAIVNGVPAIGYYDIDAQSLRYVEATDPDGIIWGSPLIVDEDGPVGEYASMIVVNGHPAISYADAGRSALRYSKSGPPPGSINWMASVP